MGRESWKCWQRKPEFAASRNNRAVMRWTDLIQQINDGSTDDIAFLLLRFGAKEDARMCGAATVVVAELGMNVTPIVMAIKRVSHSPLYALADSENDFELAEAGEKIREMSRQNLLRDACETLQVPARRAIEDWRAGRDPGMIP